MLNRLLVLIMVSFLLGCNSSRVRELQEENVRLRDELDSVIALRETARKQAEVAHLEASRKAHAAMDSVIVAENLMVVMAYDPCQVSGKDQDVDRSVDLLEEKLKGFGIEVYDLRLWTHDEQCGYELAHGENRQTIKTALTDAELFAEIEAFFRVKII